MIVDGKFESLQSMPDSQPPQNCLGEGTRGGLLTKQVRLRTNYDPLQTLHSGHLQTATNIFHNMDIYEQWGQVASGRA